MSAKISDLQERQIVNIADGKCLGNIKDHSGFGAAQHGRLLEYAAKSERVADSVAKGSATGRGCGFD